jgi:hypothetical protein
MIMKQFGETSGGGAAAAAAGGGGGVDEEQEQPKRRGARTSGDGGTMIMKQLGNALPKLPSFTSGKTKSWGDDDAEDDADADSDADGDDGVTATRRGARRSGDGATMIQKLANKSESRAIAGPGGGTAAHTAEEGPSAVKRDKKDKKDKKRKKDKG